MEKLQDTPLNSEDKMKEIDDLIDKRLQLLEDKEGIFDYGDAPLDTI